MKVFTSRAFGLLLSVILVFPGFSTGFVNPISPYSPEDFANPGVVYSNGYYYAVNTENNCSRIVIYKSDRLENLYYSSKVTVWAAPSGTDHCEAIWAPFLQYIQGNWYIYYTATWGGVLQYHRMFVIKADTQNPQGSYSDYGSVYAPNTDFYAIDGKVIVKPTDGSLYFVWSGASALPYQNIYIAPMDNPTHISGNAVMISGGVAAWENEVHEAPAFIYKNGKSVIAYSTGQLLNPGTAGYKLGTLTNTDGNYLNAASWVKSSSSVFQQWTGSAGSVYAPGACCFIKSPDGTEDWIVYHAKHFNDYNYNREIRAQKFTWDANNNPLLDHPIPSGVVQAVPSGQDGNPAEIVSGATYKIVARHSAKALTVVGSSVNAGSLVEQRAYSGADAQKWVLTDLGNGYYKMISALSGLSLNVLNYSVDNGASVIQQVYTGYDDELWKICNLGNGYYVITARHSEKCLDVVGASGFDGALVDQWPFLGNYNQEWQLIKLDATSVAAVTVPADANLQNSVISNPCGSFIEVSLNNGQKIESLELLDLSGRIVKRYQPDQLEKIKMDVSGINNGIYMLRISSNERVYGKKLIINNKK